MPAIDSIVKVLLAIVLGGVLGFERERRGRPAGLRTHILVCLASTLLMIVSMKFLEGYQARESDLPLPQGFARIAAGVVTGIGFLGAGTIINIRNVTRGLTTAASIWFVSILGIAISTEAYAVAVIATVTAFAVLHVLSYIEQFLPRDRYCQLTIRAPSGPDPVPNLQAYLHGRGIIVSTTRLKQLDAAENIEIVLSLRRTRRVSLGTLLKEMRQLLGSSVQIEIEQ